MSTLRSSGGLRPFQPQQFGRFTLLAPIAAGGMGQIYLARARFAGGLEKLCVIKKVLPELARDPGFAARFREEARTLIQLQHGSIAQVYDSGEEAGEWWIAMEFVDGKDLRRLMQRMRAAGRRIPLAASLYVAVKILEALAYAHRKKDEAGNDLGLVHRDVSPQNVLLSYEGEVKVIDFGLARSRINEPERNPSVVMGKFHYMAPEQARNLPLDRRADLYAVGVVLYESITGWNPFEEASPNEVVEWAATPRIPPIQRLAQEVPESLAQAMARALAIDPSQRFGTAEEMRASLGACLAEVAPAAGPELLAELLVTAFAEEHARERAWIASLNAGEAPPVQKPAPQDQTRAAEVAPGDPFATGLTPPGHAGAITEPRLPAGAPPPEPIVPWDRERSHGAAALRSAAAAASSVPRGVPWYESASAGWRGGDVPQPEATPRMPIQVRPAAVEVALPGVGEPQESWAPQHGPTPPGRPPADPWALFEDEAEAAPAAAAPAEPSAGHLVRETTPGRGQPTRETAPAGQPGERPALVAPAARRGRVRLAVAAALILSGIGIAWMLGGGEDVQPPVAATPPVIAAPAPSPAPEPVVAPEPAAVVPEPEPVVAKPEPAVAPPAPKPVAAPKPAAPPVETVAVVRQPSVQKRDPKDALLAKRRRVLGKYEALVAAHGADQVGGIIAGLVQATDSQFQRLIDDPGHHDDLQRQLDELDRVLEERRLAFAR